MNDTNSYDAGAEFLYSKDEPISIPVHATLRWDSATNTWKGHFNILHDPDWDAWDVIYRANPSIPTWIRMPDQEATEARITGDPDKHTQDYVEIEGDGKPW